MAQKKEERFEKVVEWNKDSFGYIVSRIIVIILSCVYLIRVGVSLWIHNYFTVDLLPFDINIFLYSLIGLIAILTSRKVYWRKLRKR